MEVHINTRERQARIDRWVSETGRPADQLAEEAMAAYLDEIAEAHTTLDRRYDDIETGKVNLINGEDVRREMNAKIQAQRDLRG